MKPSSPSQPRLSRILVAEDEHLVAADLTARLADMGFTVVGPVTDGEAAAAAARAALPDLALLDIRMPKRSGLEVAKEIFSELLIPVVLLSAYSDAASVADASAAGVFGYVVKPASNDQLRVAIDVAWSRFLDLRNQRTHGDDLARRLEERKLVEQAKWILVSSKGLSEPDAMKHLQKAARDSRRKLTEVAKEIIGSAPA
jgi:response regulator NasT